MTIRTITFDDEQWQVVPKDATDEMLAATSWPGCAATDYAHMLAAAPEPPAQQRAMIPPGMWEFDALIDFIHEHGADSEGVKGMAERLVSAFMPPAQQPLQHGMAVRQLGIVGKAFDTPDVRRAYTYSDQPDNVVAMKLGNVASKARSGGDSIDYGLQLLQRLQAAGFGVFELDGIGKGESNAD